MAAPHPPPAADPLSALRIGVIGAGRLGTAIAWALAEAGLPPRAVASRHEGAAHRLTAGMSVCRVVSAQAVVDACDLVFLTVPDDAIAAVADALRWRTGMSAVHCSGATEVAALDSALRDGAAVGGFHPLQSFGQPVDHAHRPDAGRAAWGGCTVTIEAQAPLDAVLIGLAARLGSPVNHLPAGARGRYHAAAGYASQFVHVLLREASAIWQSWGATEDEAMQALLPLVAGTIASVQRAGVAGGMPGPVSRGDVGSVRRHVDALGEMPAPVLDLYRALCRRSVTLALERGAIDAVVAAQLLDSLDV